MDLANVPERTLSVCGKKGDILPLMFIRMLFFLLVSFVEQVTYRSGVSTHCMALVYPISQFYLCTELKILFLWTLLIVF